MGRRIITVFPDSLSPTGEIIGTPSVVRYPNLPDSIVDLPYVRFAADGAVLDTVELIPSVVSFPSQVVTFTSRDGRGQISSSIRIDPPASDSGSLPPAPVAKGDSVLVSWSVSGDPPVGSLAVTRTRAGAVIFETAVSYPPRAVEESYLDSVASARPRGLQLTPADSAELAQAARSLMQMPPHHRPVLGSSVAASGVLWIRLDEIDPEIDRWLVIGENGRPRGVATLRAGSAIRWTDGDRIWVVERDDFDVSWLVRYRLSDSPGG
jgi:hypothetical protein